MATKNYTWNSENDELYDLINDMENTSMDMDEIEKKLAEVGCKVKWGDSGIDDGCDDDDEDEYVMYQSCDITDINNESTWVKFYYGNNTYKITYIEIR